MFDKFVAGLVTTHLGKYFENVNREQVKVSLWSGHVKLRNLRFRRDALRAFDTAVCVKEGHIDELTVIIPWTRLQSECVVVEVKRVRVVLQQKTAAGYDPAREKEEAYERKLHQLNLFEVLLQQELAGEETKVEATPAVHTGVPTEGVLEEEEDAFVEARKDVTFAARLKAVILNNVQLMLSDVVLQYEGCYASGEDADTGTGQRVGQDHHSVSIVLDHFRTYACDENFNPHFTAARDRVLYKKVVLEGVQVLLDATALSMQRTGGGGDDNYAIGTVQEAEEVSLDVIRRLSRHTKPSTLRRRQSARRHRIISPFSAVACVQYQPVPYRTDLPTARIDLHVDILRAVLSREEWAILRALWREARDGEEYDVLRQFRPVGAENRRPTDNARAWWTYAIQVTLHRIRQSRQRRVFVWETYKHLKAAREEYMTLFKRARRRQLGANWLAELTMEETTRLQELEMELPMESIKLARRLAYHRTHLEREQRDTVLERRRQQKQQQQEEAKGASGELGHVPDGQAVMDDVAHAGGKGRSSWWSWAFFSRTRNSPEEVLDEEPPDIRAEIEEMFQLVHAERWTAAQRLAIAKEFCIPESEVEGLSDAGGSASTGNFEGLRWQACLHVHALELTLRETDGEGAPFATLAMEKLTANLSYMFNRCFSFGFDVDDYMVLSHLEEQSRVVSILRVAKERYVVCGCEHEAAMSLLLKRHHPGSLAEYDAASGVPPYELRLKWSPVDCNMDMPFLLACVDFVRPLPFSSFSSLSAPSPAPSLCGGDSSSKRRQETMDPKMRRTLLMMVVEREFLCSWQVLVHDVRIVASEGEWQVSRIKLRRLEVKNDPAKKLEKRRRIQCLTGVSDTFGDSPDDWVNTVHATIGGVTAECLLSTTRVDANCPDTTDDDSKRQWDRIAALPCFTIRFKKSVLMRRSPSIPLLSASLVFEQPLQFRCSRQNLSALCTSFLMVTDIFQRVSQPAAITALRDVPLTSPSMVFLAQVLTVDERYLVEHEPSPRWQQERFYREKMRAPGPIDAYRRVEVAMGKMIVHHARRPSFPSHFFELFQGHLHTVQEAAEVSLFVESGGLSHACRNGVLRAKEVLFGKYNFPPLWSMPLLESFIEDWCHEHRRSGREEEEREEVKGAFQIIRMAARTRPCRHIRMRFRSAEEAEHFSSALHTHAAAHHALDIPPDPTPMEEEEMEKQHGEDQQLRLLAMDMSIPQCRFLLRDEAIENYEESATPPVHEVVMTAVNISYVQQQNKKAIDLATNGLSVTAHGRNAPVVEVARPAAKPHASSTTSADDCDVRPALTLLFQMKNRLYPHAARKYMNVTASADVKLAFSSELLCVVEMLWDLTGITTNQIFGHVRYRSIPWSDEPAAAIEEKWRADPAGGLLQNDDVSIRLGHLVLSLYYPSDRFELADNLDAAVNDGVHGKPVAVIKGSEVNIHWSNTEGCNKSSVTLHRPYVMMQRVPSGELGHVVAPAGSHRKEETARGTLTGKPALSLSFSIHREPPMLSTSDFIANGGFAGYRYTHFLSVSGEYLNIVYWQPQLWSLVEVLSRGVISRAALLVWREPYIAGAPLLRWPQPDAPLAPFSWCLLHKRLEVSHSQYLLPEKRADLPAKLWGKVDLLRLCDELRVGGGGGSTIQKRFVRHVSSLTLEGLEVRGMRRKRCSSDPAAAHMVTFLGRTRLLFEFSYELFRVGGWKGMRPRRFRVEVPEDVVFQGNTHQFALVVDWFFVNYLEMPWKGRFAPKRVSIDPFILAYGAGGESTAWCIDIRYICLRLRDPARLYRCAENEADSAATFESPAIDIAVVVERLMVGLEWGAGGAFSSRYGVGEASVWQLEPLSPTPVAFNRHPKEAVDESFRFLRLHRGTTEAATPTTMEGEEESRSTNPMSKDAALWVRHEVTFEEEEKKVSSEILVDSFDISAAPYFLFNLKDSLFSLRLRNACGRILRWEPRAAGVLPPPSGPELQDCSINQCFTLCRLNLTVPQLLRPCQRVRSLFFASVKSIECVLSSEKHGMNYVWSISVDSVGNNGVVVEDDASEGGWKLRSVFVPPLWPEEGGETEKGKKMFYLARTAENHVTGAMASVWIVLPLKREICALREVFAKGGYEQLRWLWTFFEERQMWRKGMLHSPTHDSPAVVHFTIKAPCVVVAEHGCIVAGGPDLGRGVVLSSGDTVVEKDTSDGGAFRVSLSAVSVRSLQEHAQYVMKPMGVDIRGIPRENAAWEMRVRIRAIVVEVEQLLYELLLHSLVRHFVVTEAELLDVVHEDTEDPTLCLQPPMGGPMVCDPGAAAASAAAENAFALRLCVEWDSFTLRVLRNNVGFFLKMGEMSASYDLAAAVEMPSDVPAVARRRMLVKLTFVTIGADNRPNLLDMRPTSPSLSCPTGDHGDEKGEKEPSAEALPSHCCLSFCLDACSKAEEEIQVDFGRAVGLLEKSTMQLLLLTLYEPYRRIVLPEFHVHEVRYIDSDVTLQERLVLSQRTKVRVVQGRQNHITIDGNGHDIHFIDARSPLLSLGDGLTLCIINARIHLYGKVLEYYMAVGNGSYVIADATRNTFINAVPPSYGGVSNANAGLDSSASDLENMEEENASFSICCETKKSGHRHGEDDAPAPCKERCCTNSVTRRVVANVVLLLTLPEKSSELHVPPQQTTYTAQFSRSLVLQATMSVRMEMVRCDGHVVDASSTFDMTDFALYCKYLDADGGLVETRSLVSKWALTVHHMQSYTPLENLLRRRIEVLCPHGIELRLCYGDVYLCWDAFLQAQQTLGRIEKNVLDDVVGSEVASSLETPWYTSQQSNRTTKLEIYTSLSFNLRYLSVDLVDDSTDVSIPLFCARIENLTTPTVEKRGLAFKLHVSFTWSIIYYNFSTSSWCLLLEPVLLDVVLRSDPNVSLDDVKRRKGLLRAGLHLRPVRLHLSERVMENLRRIWLLKKRLGDARHSFESDVVWKPVGASKQQFCMYRVVQNVGHKMEARFAHDSQNPSPTPIILNANETIQFNFPRVEGHELPPRQHRLLVSFRNNTELVNVAKTEKRLVFCSPGAMGSHLLVDVTVSEGQKLVEFRTNVAFKNELPFSMNVFGVGLIPPDGVLHVPLGCLRCCTSFMPHMEGHRSTPCSLGVCYDMLPFFYEQVFLGVCTVESNETAEATSSTQASTSLRRAVFFFIRFDEKSCVGGSDVIDCRGTFEAPFFIVNGTSLPMLIRLMYRRKTEKRHLPPFKVTESNSYEHVTTIDVASGERSCITQVNPLKDIYIDIFITQANGEPMGTAPGDTKSILSPALVHSVSKRECDRTITLHDKRGASIILHVECTPRVVTIWCPYWIVNRTPHCLQIADVKNGTLAAGLCSEEGITPGSFESVGGGIYRTGPAYLLNTKRMEKMGDKAVIYVSIGRYAFSSGIQWTKWSDPVPVGALRECGVVNCSFYKNVNLSLSYTVQFVGGRTKATRVVTFSPRWILQNCTDNIITFRQNRIKLGESMGSLLRPVDLAPDHSQFIDFGRGGDAANAIQVRLPAAAEVGIQRCHWSQPLNIDKLSERAFNIHYEIRMKVQDGGCVYPDDTVVQIEDVSYVTRAGSDVLMLSCHRRGSTMYVVVSRPYRPPLVVENRTRYTINVRQQDVPQLVVVYPRTTRGFAWEDSKSRPVMELWVAEGRKAGGKPLFINFDPQAVLKHSEQLQQTLRLPGGVTLFVRVRSLSRTSYAISITTENTIDTFCSLPYFQFFFRVKVDSIHALLSDENEDFILLTVKPVKVSFSQGKEAEGHGDEQTFSASVSVIQLDDERRCAKQRVVMQLVDGNPFTIRFSRKLLRWTPIVYFKEFIVNLSSMEVHLEDSFICQAMKYLERMRGVLGNTSVTLSPTHTNGRLSPLEMVGKNKRAHAKEVWKQQIVFMDHLLIEQTMVSISLYRSPGAQNDPMWEQLGYLSLFIRSVQDARFVWRRIEQWGVYETMWLLGASYSAFYKHQLQQQLSNVVHVAGLDMMRGFVTDLLQGYFTSAIITNIDPTKLRLGRRAEAHFAHDEKSLSVMGEAASSSHNIHGDLLGVDEDGSIELGKSKTEPHVSVPPPSRFHAGQTPENGSKIIEAALRLPWSGFFARAKDIELCQYGIFAVQRFVRTLDLANPSRMQWQMQDLMFNGSKVNGTVQKDIEPCERCAYIETMREQRFQSESLSILPHPDSGLITWAEFVHHISWNEFVQICAPSEIRRYAGVVMRSLVGKPINVIRIDSDKELTSDKEIT